jgi:hypothetical protein
MKAKSLLGWSAVLVALAGVFASYLLPGMAMTLATQLWNCF